MSPEAVFIRKSYWIISAARFRIRQELIKCKFVPSSRTIYFYRKRTSDLLIESHKCDHFFLFYRHVNMKVCTSVKESENLRPLPEKKWRRATKSNFPGTRFSRIKFREFVAPGSETFFFLRNFLPPVSDCFAHYRCCTIHEYIYTQESLQSQTSGKSFLKAFFFRVVPTTHVKSLSLHLRGQNFAGKKLFLHQMRAICCFLLWGNNLIRLNWFSSPALTTRTYMWCTPTRNEVENAHTIYTAAALKKKNIIMSDGEL